MKVKGIITTDFVNYQKICFTIESPICDFKCDRENGSQICQNCALASAPTYEYDDDKIIELYMLDDLTKAICFQGLEPFDTYNELYNFIKKVRNEYHINDDIVIYTGYKEEEIQPQLEELKNFTNIIIKFGRFIPNQESHYDDILGVLLASPNQYARRIS